MTAPQLPAGPVTLAVSAASVVCDVQRRIMRCLAVPYGEIGNTDRGPLLVPGPGRLRMPADLSRHVLTRGHDHSANRGVCVAAEDTAAGLWLTFRVDEGPDGDALLAEMDDKRAGSRRGVSVELWALVVEADGITVTTADCLVTAAVPVPAFPSARVASVVAAHAQQEGPTVTLPVIPAAPAAPPAGAAPVQPAAPDASAAAGPVQPAAGPQVDVSAVAALLAGVLGHGAPAAVTAAPDASAGAVSPGPVGMPFGMPVSPSSAAGSGAEQPTGAAARASALAGFPDLRALVEAGAASVRNGVVAPDVAAALQQVTIESTNPWSTPDVYAGELWSGVAYQRTWVNLFATLPLLGRKVRGWRWIVKPKVGRWDGPPNEIPTNKPTREDVDATAIRFAGGHKLDRAYEDFGETEYLNSFLQAKTESYAEETDAYAREQLLSFVVPMFKADGTPGDKLPAVFAGQGLTRPTDVLRAAALAQVILRETPNVRSKPDFYVVNSLDYLALTDVTQNDVPAFLRDLGVTPDNLRPDMGVTRGTLVAGVRAAQTFRELPGSSPIRVKALDVARGSVDDALFGYAHAMNNRPGGVISVPFVKA